MLCAERERRLSSGEDTDLSNLAAAVGVSVQDAASALFASSPVRSLEEAAYDDEDSATLGSTLCDEEEEIRQFDRFALRMAIEKLSEPWQKLIILRYFRDMSQTETARILGLTQVKVSREEKKIMDFLRRELS
jgi:RNA polymerase sporulation-specific sigma factor